MSYWETDTQTDGAWERRRKEIRVQKIYHTELRKGVPKKMKGDMVTEDKEKKIVYREKVDQETKKEKKVL